MFLGAREYTGKALWSTRHKTVIYLFLRDEKLQCFQWRRGCGGTNRNRAPRLKDVERRDAPLAPDAIYDGAGRRVKPAIRPHEHVHQAEIVHALHFDNFYVFNLAAILAELNLRQLSGEKGA